jgi:hypothetical protein
MALLTVQTVTDVAGTTVVYTAANASDTVKVVDGRTKLLVRTGGTAGITVTITTYKIINGLALPNRVMSSIAANTDKSIPLINDLYANPADTLTTIAISPTTAVTTAVITD